MAQRSERIRHGLRDLGCTRSGAGSLRHLKEHSEVNCSPGTLPAPDTQPRRLQGKALRPRQGLPGLIRSREARRAETPGSAEGVRRRAHGSSPVHCVNNRTQRHVPAAVRRANDGARLVSNASRHVKPSRRLCHFTHAPHAAVARLALFTGIGGSALNVCHSIMHSGRDPD